MKTLWRITIVVLGLVEWTWTASFRCYRGDLHNYLVTPLDKPMPLATSTCIDLSLPTVFYTFGYRGRVAGPATTAVLSAYLATKKRNVVLVDWESEARSGVLGIPLGYALYAVPNAKKIGNELGIALVQLARAGLNMTQVHLVGHSLGAHLLAYAGKRARGHGFVVSRITGLDPAQALFGGSFALQSGLDRTCARFVDIIHTDPGGYGTSKPSGTVDIWPNYAGTGATQPGCPGGSFEMFSPEVYSEYYPDIGLGSPQNLTELQRLRMAIQMKPHLCSHDRSWRYFVEALASPTAFVATAAQNYHSWVARNFRPTETIYMGDLISTRARGSFFLSTAPQPPFGLGEAGTKPGTPTRRRRNSPLGRLLKFLR